MAPPKPGELAMYAGGWDCFKKILHKEGVYGFYKGMPAPLTAVVPIFATSFFGFGLARSVMQSLDESRVLSLPELFAAGAFAGTFGATVAAPGERIKCLLQVQQSSSVPPKYSGMYNCAKHLYAEGGIRTFYRGTAATMMRDVPGSGMYFMTYEWIKDSLLAGERSSHSPMYATVFAGGCAGLAYWITGMPADVLKSRLQIAPKGKYPNGMRDVFRELMTTSGPTGLYKGVTPVLIGAFPSNAICFVGFECAIAFLNWAFPDK